MAVPGNLLPDPGTRRAVEMIQGASTTVDRDDAGRLRAMRLALPSTLDARGLEAVVTLNPFPLHGQVPDGP